MDVNFTIRHFMANKCMFQLRFGDMVCRGNSDCSNEFFCDPHTFICHSCIHLCDRSNQTPYECKYLCPEVWRRQNTETTTTPQPTATNNPNAFTSSLIGMITSLLVLLLILTLLTLTRREVFKQITYLTGGSKNVKERNRTDMQVQKKPLENKNGSTDCGLDNGTLKKELEEGNQLLEAEVEKGTDGSDDVRRDLTEGAERSELSFSKDECYFITERPEYGLNARNETFVCSPPDEITKLNVSRQSNVENINIQRCEEGMAEVNGNKSFYSPYDSYGDEHVSISSEGTITLELNLLSSSETDGSHMPRSNPGDNNRRNPFDQVVKAYHALNQGSPKMPFIRSCQIGNEHLDVFISDNYDLSQGYDEIVNAMPSSVESHIVRVKNDSEHE